ncbi:hypothetical protein A9P82_09315 [Arachidicoccus ginsenosidimutans]|uniref:helix-turn-helix domain-containing protein n=1 Tax=Arachidicoccus sp. BS20 TaxID=1850526 RepID=UPI0007F06CEE|nr:helix-turn-helix domain-containing protein [Arachidicoccus sp. BS20]ANI89473.1 hypothetical protein A9P82_09315 [Arachidicoccus sp. BS20]
MKKNEYLNVGIFSEKSLAPLVDNKNFVLLWLDEGSAEIIFNFQPLRLKTKKLYVLGPESVSRINKSKGIKGGVLVFSIDFLQMDGKDYTSDIFRLFFVLIENPVVDISTEQFKEFRIIALLLYKEYTKPNASIQILHSYLKILMLTLMRAQHLDASIPKLNLQRVHDFFLLLFNHSKEEKSVTFYARQLNISAKRLNQILHIFTHHSASYFIHEHLIIEAKRQLVTGKYSVKEVSDYLGFEDRAYFSRFFKKKTGVPPEQFSLLYYKNQ